MGKAFLSKSIGGGGGLNFRVIGGTSAPASPKANDIWVNTDTPITSYIFSAAEPEAYAAGMVWISVGATSPVAFNALKNNNITVYPIFAKQHIGGTWVDKTAKSYQGGAWKEWMLYLYKEGNTYAELTGGYTANHADITFATDHIYVNNGKSQAPNFYTNKKIDLTNVDKLYLEIYEVTSNSYDSVTLYLVVSDSQMTDISNTAGDIGRASYALPKSASGLSVTLDLDVSQIVGEHYVNVGSRSSGNGPTATYKIREIRGE